ncbi:hypothetical protein F5Y17DRAFT_469311 [Xylariaceae sp. FL0594]|nr:hypothetical protein F5Y17DRAFT_469311 [Xylariaceae sp. FL0594]
MASEQLIETWVLYSLGSLVIFTRIAVRLRMVGIRGFMPDDYLIFLSWATYTVMTVAAHIVGGLGDMHALPMSEREALSAEDAASYVYATQWFCAGVATYLLFIWTLKLNMLFLYQRVVRGLWVERLIKPTMYVVGASFAAIYLILFCACRPFHRMWVIYPDQGPYCQPQSVLNMVPPLVLNIVTDIMIMATPAPVVLKVQTALWKRISLIALFGAVVFIMIAAILRVTMVLILKSGPVAAIWSCREDFVAIVVGQSILIRPMFARSFWGGSSSTIIKDNYHRQGSGKETDDMEGRSVEIGSYNKNNNNNKVKDPFSLTAALVTVDDDDENGLYNKGYGGSNNNGSAVSGIHGADEEPKRLENAAGERQWQQRQRQSHHGQSTENKDKLVIHVSKNVVVEAATNTNLDSRDVVTGSSRESSSFQATATTTTTTRARAWNGV